MEAINIEKFRVKNNRKLPAFKSSFNQPFVNVTVPHKSEFMIHPKVVEYVFLLFLDDRTYIVSDEVVEKYGDQLDDLYKVMLLRGKLLKGYEFIYCVREARNPDYDMACEQLKNAARVATKQWTSLEYNKPILEYEVTVHKDIAKQVTWADVSLIELMGIAFKGYMIDSVDHPVIAGLVGNNHRPDVSADGVVWDDDLEF